MGTLVEGDSYLNLFSGKRVLITGHTGFKGSWLALILRLLGAQVMGYALPPEDENSHYSKLNLKHQIEDVNGDVRDLALLSSELKSFQPEFVFHLAAQALVRASYDDPRDTFEINVGGGVNVLEAVRLCDSARALVFVTSDKCYENREWVWGYRETDALGGHDPYSASKAAAEIAFSSYGRSFFSDRSNLGAATVRAGNVIGGGDWSIDRLVPDCIRSLASGKPILLRSPTATRPWQHVLEPISGYLKLAARLYQDGSKFGGSWNFGPPLGAARTVMDLAQRLAQKFDDGGVVLDSPLEGRHEANLLQLSSEKANQLLDWYTRWNFEETVDATGDWYRSVCLQGESAEVVSKQQISRYFNGFL